MAVGSLEITEFNYGEDDSIPLQEHIKRAHRLVELAQCTTTSRTYTEVMRRLDSMPEAPTDDEYKKIIQEEIIIEMVSDQILRGLMRVINERETIPIIDKQTHEEWLKLAADEASLGL